MMNGVTGCVCHLILLIATAGVLGFAPPRGVSSPTRLERGLPQQATSTRTELFATTNKQVEITFPSQDDAAAMGIRDWPQQFHSKSWSESVAEGLLVSRYVLSGNGRITVDYYDENDDKQRISGQRVYAGTLVEVDGEANIFWDVESDDGMIVLTPNYEEGGKLLLVGGALAVFCAGLIIGSGNL
mmetsp:Transcript_10438/g.22659  ORF Transcript_10438/g.22659 Transcript_10438/m.22659 type:complete len:185 (-) Transcript_10438:203-757(-)